jgi:hypothetical protein
MSSRLVILIAFMAQLTGTAIAGDLEPFTSVPVPEQNPQTP